MVQLHNFFFLITSMVVPRGTAAPVLLKWFVSRDVPTGAPFYNVTIIPIPIPSFPLVVYLHSRKFIRSTNGAKSGVLVRASRPILLPDIIGRSSSETRARNALFRFVLVLHFLLLESKADFSYLESFCGVLCLLFFCTFFFLPRDRSAKRERARRRKGQRLWPNGNEQRRNDKMRCPRHPHLERRAKEIVQILLFLLVLVGVNYGWDFGSLVAACDGGRGSPSVTAELHPAGEPREETPPPPPIDRSVLVPELIQPLLPDNIRMLELQQRLAIYFIDRHDEAHLPQFLGILEKQMLLEKRIEAALVRDGYAPEAVYSKRKEIRGIVFNHPTRTLPLSERTLNGYLSQIERDGTRLSIPYCRVIRAIGDYNLLLRRNND